VKRINKAKQGGWIPLSTGWACAEDAYRKGQKMNNSKTIKITDLNVTDRLSLAALLLFTTLDERKSQKKLPESQTFESQIEDLTDKMLYDAWCKIYDLRKDSKRKHKSQYFITPNINLEIISVI